MSSYSELTGNPSNDTPYVLTLIENSRAVSTSEIANVELRPEDGPGDTIFHVVFQSATALLVTPGSTSLFFSGGPGGGSATSSAILSFQQTLTDGVYRIEADVSALATTRGFQFACFASGTRIATPDGSVDVQDLKSGDIVTTVTGPAAVTWIGHRRVRDVDVVRVRIGTLGANCDLILSDDHALFIDGYLVPAGLLTDGIAITRERREEITFWHVELAQHTILSANGVQAESYLDTGNRHQFGNCPMQYDPAILALQEPYAEMVFAGDRLERIRNRLLARQTA